MKRLLVPLLLLLPGVAMADLKIVSGQAKAEPAAQGGKVADLASLTIKAPAVLATPAAEAKRPAAVPVAVAVAVAAAAPAKVVPVQSQAEPKKTWRVTVADRSIRAALERWTKEAGYQLFWEFPEDLEQSGHLEFTATFDDALLSLMKTNQASGYSTEAIIYDDNKAVRVVKHTPQEQ